MSLLKDLSNSVNSILSRNPQQMPYLPAKQKIPVGQSIPQSFMDSYNPQTKALAQIYNQNPQDARVAHLDPKMFGYAPDNTANAQVRPTMTLDGGVRMGPMYTTPYGDNGTVYSIGGKIGQFGGTIGVDVRTQFVNANNNGTPITQQDLLNKLNIWR